jgi:hypothetical protein
MRKRILVFVLTSCVALVGFSSCGKDEQAQHATSWNCWEWNKHLPATDVPIDSPEANRALDQLADIVRDRAGGRLDDSSGVKGRLAFYIRRECRDASQFRSTRPDLAIALASETDRQTEGRQPAEREQRASPDGPPYEQLDPGERYAPQPSPSGSAAGAAEPRPAPAPEPEPSAPPVSEPPPEPTPAPEPTPPEPPHTPPPPQPAPPPQHSP